MTKAHLPQPITGHIGKKVLQNAGLVFNNKIGTIITELFQNSRRAEATEIHISYKKTGKEIGRLTVRDNGTGIPQEKFSKILGFGDSGWDDETEIKETPAGMGLFSLCERNPTITSNGFEIALTESVFLGKEMAIANPTSETFRGTEISFDLTAEDHKNTAWNPIPAYKAAIMNESLFSLMAVFLDDIQLPRKTFGKSALASFIENDLKVYIYSAKPENREECGHINFFGHLIPEKEFGFKIYNATNPNRILGKYPALKQFSSLRKMFGGDEFAISVEMLGTKTLKPKLPDRQEIQSSPAIEKIVKRAKFEIYSLIAKAPYHCLSKEHYEEALSFGIQISPPLLTLTSSEGEWKNTLKKPDTIFLPNEETPENTVFFSQSMLEEESISLLTLYELCSDNIAEQNNATFFRSVKPQQKQMELYFVPKNTQKYIPQTITSVLVSVTDNYGKTESVFLAGSENDDKKLADLITKIKSESSANVSKIRFSLMNAKKENVFSGEIPFLLTSTGAGKLYFPDGDIILFSNDIKTGNQAFNIVKEKTYNWEYYDDTPYGNNDRHDGDEGEENFDSDLQRYIIQNKMTKNEYDKEYANLIRNAFVEARYKAEESLKENIKKISVNIYSDGEQNSEKIEVTIYKKDGTKSKHTW